MFPPFSDTHSWDLPGSALPPLPSLVDLWWSVKLWTKNLNNFLYLNHNPCIMLLNGTKFRFPWRRWFEEESPFTWPSFSDLLCVLRDFIMTGRKMPPRGSLNETGTHKHFKVWNHKHFDVWRWEVRLETMRESRSRHFVTVDPTNYILPED